MNKNLIIIGTGYLASNVYNLIKENFIRDIKKNSIKNFITFDKKQKNFNGKQCKYFYDIKKFDKKSEYIVLLENVFFRKEITSVLINHKLRIANIISKTSILSSDLKIGYGNVIHLNSIIHDNTIIENSNLIFENVIIAHHNNIGSFNNYYTFSSTSGNVKCENLNNFFKYSSVNPKVKIGSKCIIFPRQTVSKNMKSFEIKK